MAAGLFVRDSVADRPASCSSPAGRRIAGIASKHKGLARLPSRPWLQTRVLQARPRPGFLRSIGVEVGHAEGTMRVAEAVVGRPGPAVLAPGRRGRVLRAGAPLRRGSAVGLRRGRRVSERLTVSILGSMLSLLILLALHWCCDSSSTLF